MSKKVQKTLTGAMAAMMATGVVTPLAATNDVDALYKAAYNATTKALNEKTQAAINEARAAIKALPANLDWAIGEFSKQVDTVQHPIFVNIVEAIKKAEKETTQANIEAAKKAIPAELGGFYKNSYSSAVDKIQQGLQAKVIEAVKKAEKEETEEAVEAARALVEDVLKAESKALRDWAKIFSDRLDAVKIYDLDVTKIVEITRDSVTVEFEKLTETMKDVDLKVVDSEGTVHEVYTKNLLKGVKSTKFEFKKAVPLGSLKGAWTVNGVNVNLTASNMVDDLASVLQYNYEDETEYIVDADDKAARKEALRASDVGSILVRLQEDEFIEGLLGDYNIRNVFVFDTYNKVSVLSKYIEALKAKKTNELKTAEDVQEVIDKVNAELSGTLTVDELINLAKKSGTTAKQMAAAMEELGLVAVNEDWGKAYKDALKELSLGTKLEDVQKTVFDTNKKEIIDNDDYKYNITDKYDDDKEVADQIELVQEKLELVEAYYKEDEGKETAKADLVKELREDLALLEVKAVTDASDLSQALLNLSNVVDDKDEFSFDKHINEYIMEDYFGGNLRAQTSVKDLKDAAKTIQASVFTTEIAKLSLENIVEDLKSDKLGLKDIINDNKAAYIAEKDLITGDYDAVQKAIKAINARVDMTKATTKAEMRKALVSLVENHGNTALTSKSTKQIDDLAEEFLNLRDAKDSNKIDLAKIENILGADKAGTADGCEFKKVADKVKSKLDNINDGDITVGDLEAIIGEGNVKAGMPQDLQNAINKDGDFENYTDVRKALGL